MTPLHFSFNFVDSSLRGSVVFVLIYFPVLQVEHFNTLCMSEYLLYSVFLFRTNIFYVSGKFSNSINSYVQECIPVGCVPPARNRTWVGVSLDRDPHGKRAPQTETPILDRDPSPGQRPPLPLTVTCLDRGPSPGLRPPSPTQV